MAATLRRAPLLLGSLLVLACDPARPPPSVDAGPARLEVGAGEAAFEAFDDGDLVPLVMGPQGGYHVPVSVRVAGLDPRGTILDLRLTRDRDGATVSQTFVVRVSLEALPTGLAEAWGLTLVVPEPDQAVEEPLTLRVRVTERAESGGRTLELERRLVTAWPTNTG